MLVDIGLAHGRASSSEGRWCASKNGLCSDEPRSRLGAGDVGSSTGAGLSARKSDLDSISPLSDAIHQNYEKLLLR